MRDFAFPRWLWPALIVGLALIWAAMLRFGAGPFDRRALETIYAGGHPALVTIARVLTFIGEPTILIGLGLLAALWLWNRRQPRYAVTIVFVTLLGRGLAELQKYEIARPRPELEAHLVVTKTYSFPSGHATSSMIVYLTLALVLTAGTRWTRPAVAAAIALSLLIGLSRIMLGVHWPSDVVGGWMFGLLWVLVAFGPADRWLRHRFPNGNETVIRARGKGEGGLK